MVRGLCYSSSGMMTLTFSRPSFCLRAEPTLPNHEETLLAMTSAMKTARPTKSASMMSARMGMSMMSATTVMAKRAIHEGWALTRCCHCWKCWLACCCPN